MTVREWEDAFYADPNVGPMVRMTLSEFARAFEEGRDGVAIRYLTRRLNVSMAIARKHRRAAEASGYLRRTRQGEHGTAAGYVPTLPGR